ncbi:MULTISPECIES: hypothetical protein [Pseudomonas]|uniref:hypothetical protein n=1 Tax=Pseudomonas TaxID=286 RepID=UPI0008C8D597|nr:MULTISPECIES: hypothetical protein [Pseudomonas]WDG52054.1 hypothetical protein PUP76_19455 [Pseudomonas chlororaphis]WDH86929.1 hypothetical protein PUP74_22730 [Pseudomonas chlororaphis]SEL45693.1 hypothetical protein SAMN03159414_2725 [Pseudomonas sp. NFACC41-3]SMH49874.1 hypothetical protein SAMN03159362_2842 [Pseudomonas sp. NFIX51]
MNLNPIFVHSLFRSGSTYLFNVFRRANDKYWCYQEPENEWLLELDERPELVLAVGASDAKNVNHPDIGLPYFWEFLQIKDSLVGLFKKEISFQDIFLEDLTTEQHVYFSTLISEAKNKPVLQLCRSFGRAAALKKSFGGVHLHLWREPRSQWWSFKINDYFDAATQLIFMGGAVPDVLRKVYRHVELQDISLAQIDRARVFAESNPLDWRRGYYLFFSLWVYSNICLESVSDISVCIDNLSLSDEYRAKFKGECLLFGLDDINVDDCKIPQVFLGPKEATEYSKIESEVLGLFREYYSDREIDALISRLDSLLRASGSYDLIDPQSVQARSIALRLTDRCAFIAEKSRNEIAVLHKRLMEVDEYTKGLVNAVDIKQFHIEKVESHNQDLANAIAIKDDHIMRVEGLFHDLTAVVELKEKEIASLRREVEYLSGEMSLACERAAILESRLTEFSTGLDIQNGILQSEKKDSESGV